MLCREHGAGCRLLLLMLLLLLPLLLLVCVCRLTQGGMCVASCYGASQPASQPAFSHPAHQHPSLARCTAWSTVQHAPALVRHKGQPGRQQQRQTPLSTLLYIPLWVPIQPTHAPRQCPCGGGRGGG